MYRLIQNCYRINFDQAKFISTIVYEYRRITIETNAKDFDPVHRIYSWSLTIDMCEPYIPALDEQCASYTYNPSMSMSMIYAPNGQGRRHRYGVTPISLIVYPDVIDAVYPQYYITHECSERPCGKLPLTYDIDQFFIDMYQMEAVATQVVGDMSYTMLYEVTQYFSHQQYVNGLSVPAGYKCVTEVASRNSLALICSPVCGFNVENVAVEKGKLEPIIQCPPTYKLVNGQCVPDTNAPPGFVSWDPIPSGSQSVYYRTRLRCEDMFNRKYAPSGPCAGNILCGNASNTETIGGWFYLGPASENVITTFTPYTYSGDYHTVSGLTGCYLYIVTHGMLTRVKIRNNQFSVRVQRNHSEGIGKQQGSCIVGPPDTTCDNFGPGYTLSEIHQYQLQYRSSSGAVLHTTEWMGGDVPMPSGLQPKDYPDTNTNCYQTTTSIRLGGVFRQAAQLFSFNVEFNPDPLCERYPSNARFDEIIQYMQGTGVTFGPVSLTQSKGASCQCP